MSIGKRLREARQNARLSQAELARRTGLTQPTLSALENDSSRGSLSIAQIADTLGVNPLWLAEGRGPQYLSKAPSAAPTSDFEEIGQIIQPTKSIKVIGEIMGGVEGYLEEFSVADENFILAHTIDPKAYALRVRGDSMRPRYRPGEYLLIEPSYEAHPGEDVAICLEDGRKMLKELIIVRPKEIEVLSVSDGQRLTLPRQTIQGMHRVAGHYQRHSSLIISR
jgi:phage repressor protein C with HTH and peptisase S24 domain